MMKICYLLESTELCGGVRIVFDQARALSRLGHDVIVRAKAGNHDWYGHAINVDYVSDLASPFNSGQSPDVVIATFWTTVVAARELGAPQVYHLCQGYEADFPEYSHIARDIEDIYRLPVAKLTIGPWLDRRLLAVFGSENLKVHCIGQIVDDELFHPPRFSFVNLVKRTLSTCPNLLVVGNFSVSVKAIPCALQAVALLREKGCPVSLTRVATEPSSDKELEHTQIQQYFTNITPAELAMLYRRSDIFLASSNDKEGFGLPFAEALASGLPAVATEIPSYTGMDMKKDYAVFVPQDDPEAMAVAARNLLQDRTRMKLLRKRGPQVIREHFSAERVASRLEQVFSGN